MEENCDTQSSDRFKIFNFFADNSVAVVPTTWIFNEDNKVKCHYPEYHAAKMKKTVKKCIEFQPEWPVFEGRIMHSYDDYKVAAENLSKSQYESEWSDADGNKKKVQAEAPTPSLPDFPGTAAGASSGTPATFEVEVDQMPYFELATVPGPSSGSTCNLVQSAEGLSSNTDHNLFTGFQQDVLMQLKAIQDVQVAHSNLLQNVLRKLEDKDKKDQLVYKFSRDHFPLKSIADLEHLDKLICENPDAYASLKMLFCSRGGGNAEEAVKLMLKFLLTDELQDGHCYRGQLEKKGFCNYNAILQCILDSLKDNVHTRGNATMMVLDNSMSKALKQASDRVNQRKIRRANAAAKSKD